MTDLSPAAQAIWNAYLNESEWDASQCELDAIAAALRAAADLVVPHEDAIPTDGELSLQRRCQRRRTRAQLLAIAAELEGPDAC